MTTCPKREGECDYCGHIRYTNDLFNGGCVPCVLWAEDQINALRARAEAAEAAAKWQPIETAPKDGTDVQVFIPGAVVNSRVQTAYYFGGMWRVWADIHAVVPTHWRPLPAPPKESKGE